MGSAGDLEAAVRVAQATTCDLLGAMTAHQMVPGILNLHLAPYWPRAVQTVFLRWQNGINQLADILAHQHTTEPAAHPIDNDRRALLIRAYVIALGLAD